MNPDLSSKVVVACQTQFRFYIMYNLLIIVIQRDMNQFLDILYTKFITNNSLLKLHMVLITIILPCFKNESHILFFLIPLARLHERYYFVNYSEMHRQKYDLMHSLRNAPSALYDDFCTQYNLECKNNVVYKTTLDYNESLHLCD